MNKMGTVPVKKLMLSMGIPIIISMMLQALYNIVDSAFVSNMEGGEQRSTPDLSLSDSDAYGRGRYRYRRRGKRSSL